MLTILSTGGTFDKIYFDAKSEFSIGEPQSLPILQQARIAPQYRIESILKKDSLDMDDSDRQLVASKVLADGSKYIVITHGTDTMVDTARVLAAADLADKVVVLVGAMQPARMRDSDAAFNLGFAIASVQLLSPGIYIAMNGQVFDHDKVQKNRTAGRFETPVQ